MYCNYYEPLKCRMTIIIFSMIVTTIIVLYVVIILVTNITKTLTRLGKYQFQYQHFLFLLPSLTSKYFFFFAVVVVQATILFEFIVIAGSVSH